ncbi:MsnO8 family LLM class oxidoreductase [Streptomyces sp. NPDC058657]|uniref:MsnO8 family LLM class oxidoreductase n=1 Tax=unclassified Streptomyces TaxID=2593676 RepID=UPI00365CB34A
MKLSLVELAGVTQGTDKPQALEEALAAARQAEDLGYHRIWYAEHHNTASLASQAPEILIALAARATERIRVGSGAVLLNHYSPFKVAETFLQLEALAPGRIDLGLGRATAGPVADLALRRDRRAQVADDFALQSREFALQVQEVLGHLRGDLPADHPLAELDPAAGIPTRPEVWLLGSSGTSAELAGRLGLGYAFAGFINPDLARRSLLRHRAGFAGGPEGMAGDRSVLAVHAVAADTDAEAQRLSWSARATLARLARTGASADVPTVDVAARELTRAEKDTPTVIADGVWPRLLAGSPDTVRDQIEQMTEATGVREVMVQDLVADPQARAHSRALLAGALGAAPAAAARAGSSG